MRRVIALALACMMLAFGALAEPAILTVRGTGIVSMDPDTATITLGVRESSTDVSEAQNAVSAKLTTVIDRLIELGVKAENIHTGSISIYEDYDYGSSFSLSQQRAYVAENTIYAEFDDIANAGKYIDAVFQAGANTFSGISFSASNTEAEKKRALELSVESARVKADVLAAAAGMKITGIQAVREESFGGGNNYATNGFDAMFAKSAVEEDAVETPVMADKLQVSASVTIDFAMEPIQQQ